MKIKKNTLSALLKQYITQYTRVVVDGDDCHLFCDKYHILIPDFLYVFRALEEKLGVPVAKVLEQRDYTVFTIRNLVDAIAEDYPEIIQEEKPEGRA